MMIPIKKIKKQLQDNGILPEQVQAPPRWVAKDCIVMIYEEECMNFKCLESIYNNVCTSCSAFFF